MSIEAALAEADYYGGERAAGHVSENGLWLGYIATIDDGVLNDELFARAKLLRGNVYVDELEWLPESTLDSTGQEQDEYDDQSTHLAMVDSQMFGIEEPFVFANLRYINRRSEDDILPVEKEFDLDIDRNEPRIEMSRFMSRHFDPILQGLASVAMISHTVGLLAREGLTGYATLEVPLLRRIKSMGLIVDQLTPMKVLVDYGNTKNCAVRINGLESIEKAREMSLRREDFPYSRFFDIARHGTNEELVDAIASRLLKQEGAETV